ncbi:MAG TPA: hypothetical protein ENG45_01025 [Candidatus Aenigmarchaeota archaeon]|nr:hypothetical protein [Candidatus Aenigmarchaeota archaeon]
MKEVETINNLLDQIINDYTVPRNIRNAVQEAKNYFNDPNTKDIQVRIGSAISVLDEIINDPNMPMYTRTQIWNIVSLLEKMRSQG